MNKAKRLVLSTLATAMAAASLTVATPTQASAINLVDCNGRSDLLKVSWHYIFGGGWNAHHVCFANAGEHDFDVPGTEWLDNLSTGNNVVQWYGDGRWQPGTPIGKWTYYDFPTVGSVKLDKIRIL
ncbi:beta/gamma crystallin domain-containing protein [Streptomyces albus]|uniref:beta/gamma crystallin domain-containing protein n=1 Tax=Streptomyces albus TaxID=1888 RepID=UPI0004C7FA97|nr:beta/gamma crystallin domain-containing protein [Streptomyces albus]